MNEFAVQFGEIVNPDSPGVMAIRASGSTRKIDPKLAEWGFIRGFFGHAGNLTETNPVDSGNLLLEVNGDDGAASETGYSALAALRANGLGRGSAFQRPDPNHRPGSPGSLLTEAGYSSQDRQGAFASIRRVRGDRREDAESYEQRRGTQKKTSSKDHLDQDDFAADVWGAIESAMESTYFPDQPSKDDDLLFG